MWIVRSIVALDLMYGTQLQFLPRHNPSPCTWGLACGGGGALAVTLTWVRRCRHHARVRHHAKRYNILSPRDALSFSTYLLRPSHPPPPLAPFLPHLAPCFAGEKLWRRRRRLRRRRRGSRRRPPMPRTRARPPKGKGNRRRAGPEERPGALLPSSSRRRQPRRRAVSWAGRAGSSGDATVG